MENAVAQVCREGGARVSTNIFLRDLDLDLQHASMDGRRLEVVAEGLSLSSAAASWPWTPLWCRLCMRTGSTDGTRTEQTASPCEKRRHKEKTYPELQGRNGRVRLVVIAGEVGGRWSEETKAFLWSLACEKSRSEARVLRGSVRAAWYRRWSCLLACAAAKAVAMSLLERRGVPGAGDEPSSAHEVVSATCREV